LSSEERQAILDRMSRWMEIEREEIQYFGSKTGSTRDERLRALYQIIYIDSLKHLCTLEAITRVLKSPYAEAKFSDLKVPLRDAEHLKRRLSEKKTAIDHAKASAETVEDEVLQILLKTIISEEIHHHDLLTAIMNTLLPAPPGGEQVREKEEELE
jgi:rubrerythrin